MSLSTQLTRGTLALPMLALFGALALVANQSADAQGVLPKAPVVAASAVAVDAEATPKADAALTRVVMSAAGRQLLIVRMGEVASCQTLPRKALLLAQTPGDLGPMVQRLGEDCRA